MEGAEATGDRPAVDHFLFVGVDGWDTQTRCVGDRGVQEVQPSLRVRTANESTAEADPSRVLKSACFEFAIIGPRQALRDARSIILHEDKKPLGMYLSVRHSLPNDAK